MRVKSNELDYRFLPEPNLPRLHLRDEWVEQAKKEVRLDAPHVVYISELGLPAGFALQVVSEPKLHAFVQKCVKLMKTPIKEVMESFGEFSKTFDSYRALYPPEE
jgi:Asp-tRNA(Asn)/Glu-tRNA(Gln) amidotransferase B subunit